MVRLRALRVDAARALDVIKSAAQCAAMEAHIDLKVTMCPLAASHRSELHELEAHGHTLVTDSVSFNTAVTPSPSLC